ncbi:helix-turn-helix domain-containing protein [Spirosoma sp. KNUC1025]|uniref:helix-turn-helix domain-containing protein n=1 Tax=Spirosoma sp. KNUC1025 TaxID=2894082 RepID=UPI00386BABD9|nr:helix-turn-helix domain-containing protein [Spirosoma sp. KNUC1025]
MEMVVMSADQVRTMMIEAASIAVKHNSPPTTLNTPKPKEPVSPEELCKRLDISKPTAWAWERKGILKGYHLGNRKYYLWDEVIAAMQKGREVEA